MLNRGRAKVDQACTKTFSYGEEGQEVGQLLDSNLVEAKYLLNKYVSINLADSRKNLSERRRRGW